jgi:hypothetical protein
MHKKLRPCRIRVEASSICQLRCPACPEAHRPSTTGNGFLTLADFQRTIEGNKWVAQVELSKSGEIFLNPELLQIMQVAYQQGVRLTAYGGANLNRVGEEVLEGLVKYRFEALMVAIDGASDETYRLYRQGGDFQTVIDHVRRINALKREYASPLPRLGWQFVIFGHNEHEIPIARKMASDLGMQFRLKLNWASDFSPVRNRDFVTRELGFDAVSVEEYKQEYGVDYNQGLCQQLWTEPQINWDGALLGCCMNWWADFGANAFDDGLLASINNDRMSYARDMLLGRKEARDDIPCATCGIYLTMRANDRWLTTPHLPPLRRRKRPGHATQRVQRVHRLAIAGADILSPDPENADSFWANVWWYYVQRNHERAAEGLSDFRGSPPRELVSLAQLCLSQSPPPDVVAVVTAFWKEAKAQQLVPASHRHEVTGLYLAALGQAFLRQQWPVVWQALRQALRSGCHPRALVAWVSFFRASLAFLLGHENFVGLLTPTEHKIR